MKFRLLSGDAVAAGVAGAFRVLLLAESTFVVYVCWEPVWALG
jgi:hypothetical protein